VLLRPKAKPAASQRANLTPHSICERTIGKSISRVYRYSRNFRPAKTFFRNPKATRQLQKNNKELQPIRDFKD
jgi:transposase-like protein